MKKEWLLLLASVITTLVLSIGVIRWLAPGLLGIASDLQLVQLDEKAPPFYKGILKSGGTSTADFILKDPLTRVRARPFFPRTLGGATGPNDILGFRNNGVPNVADIIIIGDSMTYGNNALMEQNWPAFMRQTLGREDMHIYSMATGGWAAVQYLDMMDYAEMFRPRVVVVAYYTGNDPLESFQLVYASKHWDWLIPDTTLSLSDLPKVQSPPPKSGYWAVTFNDGVQSIFTPAIRLASNEDSPVVRAGYAIMANSARLITEKARRVGSKVVFTIIPTKELVYASKMQDEGITPPEEYVRLVTLEHEYITEFSKALENIEGAHYVDVAGPLQRAAMGNVNLYPDNNPNGHPVAEGYKVIGEQISAHVEGLVPATPKGLFTWNDKGQPYYILVNNEGVWLFETLELIKENGWPGTDAAVIETRELSNLPYNGMIRTVDRRRFGPECCAANRSSDHASLQ